MFQIGLALTLSIFPNFLKCAAYRIFCNAKIGKGVKIGFGTVLWTKTISIGDFARIGVFNQIHCQNFRIGPYATIGNFNKISVNSFNAKSRSVISSRVDIKGDPGDFESVFSMGMHSWIFEYCYIDVQRPVLLGRNVGVGGGSYIFTHGLWLSQLDGFPVSYAPVRIADNTWLPWGCFIMPGVHIGENVIVGARSVVNKDVPDNALVAGIPAKVIRDKSNREVIQKDRIEMLQGVTQEFVRKRGATLIWSEEDGYIDARINGMPLLRIHLESAPMYYSQGMNIFLQPLPSTDQLGMVPWLSLLDYSSSSYQQMPQVVRDWLGFSRRIGLRFYPIDEQME